MVAPLLINIESFPNTLTSSTRGAIMVTSAVDGSAPVAVQDAVLKPSEFVSEGAQQISGIDFNKYTNRNITVAELVDSMSNMGFQATNIGEASRVINKMVTHYVQHAYIQMADQWLEIVEGC
jgi:hypothetical protein